MSNRLPSQSSGQPFIIHRLSFTRGLMNGFKEAIILRNAPTGQMCLQKNLLSLRLRITAINGTKSISNHHTIHFPVIDIMALKWNKPLDTIPIGQIAQNIGNLNTTEPISDDIIIPFAKDPLVNLVTGQKEQFGLCFFSLFSLFCRYRSFLFASILGRNFSTNLSKLSIIMPIGQTQLQKKFPNRTVRIMKISAATIVGIRREGLT